MELFPIKAVRELGGEMQSSTLGFGQALFTEEKKKWTKMPKSSFPGTQMAFSFNNPKVPVSPVLQLKIIIS